MRDMKRRPGTVLLVDDSDELRQATRELLEEMGHAVSAAPGAEEALAAFGPGGGERRFDVLVTDVFMPGKSGVELADALLARDRALPVVLTSSRGGEPEVRRRLAAGDVAFLAKPFSPGELAAAIAEAKRRAAGRPAAGRPVERRSLAAGPPAASGRPRAASRPAWRLAAAVAMLLGAGILLRGVEPGAPPLPAPVAEAVRRSAVIEPLAPVGAVAEAPQALRWRPFPGSDAYAVRLRGVDGAELWQARVEAPEAALPTGVAAGLERAVTYYWSVDALAAGDRRLASSGPVRFAIDLARRPNPTERP